MAIISHLNFQTIIDNIPGHIYWIDIDGKIMGCNLEQARFAGFDCIEDFIGKTDFEMPWKNDAPKIQELNQKVLSLRTTIVQEEKIKLDSGEDIIFLSKKTPLYDAENNIIGILGISIDITAEKETEKLREEKETLQKQVALSEHIGAIVAHEVRTPLSAIQVGTNCIKDLLEATPLQEAKELCQSILSQVSYVESFIDTFLMNVKDQTDSKARICEIKMTIDSAIAKYPFGQKDKPSLIQWQSGFKGFKYSGEETLMAHVVFNLMKNAFYFIAKARKGHIELSTSEDEKNNYLHFKDTAQGIAEEDLNYIFDRFYTKTGVGTGIGLSYCKMVMNSIEGDIRCQSILGEYAEFILRFPKV